MEVLTAHAWQWMTLLILLACSGFLSGSETALFSLSRHQLHTMRQGRGRFQRLAADLMAEPRRLLATLLIGNNTVNVLIFAVSYNLIRDVGHRYGALAASIGGITSLLTVVVFGEVIPKVIASAGAGTIAPLVAPAVHAFQSAVSPLRLVLETLFVEPLMRLIGRPAPTAPHVTADELRTLLSMSHQDAGIDPGQSSWLQQVVDLTEARVHEVMVPRVDVVAFDLASGTNQLRAMFRKTRLMKIPVYEGDIDRIVGLVYAHDALSDMNQPLSHCVRPVRFVPEQMRLEQLLGHFRQTRTQLAIVVDEYGGMSGLVTLEDVLEHIVGDIRDEDHPPERPDVEPLEDGQFTVAGRLSVRALAQALGPAVLDDRVDTIAGLFVARLGKIPHVGERVDLANLVMTVESMIGRRIDRVRIRLENGAQKEDED
ncbi:MAG: HlyC/CorC family transporter [Phycisphaerae bacterium]|nr:HlyC/CorC family transporter [Phycisphaerae bacterium]